MELNLLGSIAEIEALTSSIDLIWAAVLAVGVAMVGYRVGKRVLGKF
tara:strand:- start:298 stop:438 length:141 start_codon:yes stop_codon:yes gene_type:complete